MACFLYNFSFRKDVDVDNPMQICPCRTVKYAENALIGFKKWHLPGLSLCLYRIFVNNVKIQADGKA